MVSVTICGHFGGNNNFLDGQTVKTKNLYKALTDRYGFNEVKKIDTYNWKKRPIKLLKECINAAKNSKNIIILPAHNGIKVFVPLFTFLKKKYKFNLIYAVVGGWLKEFLTDKPKLIKKIKKIDMILVETNTMKLKLQELNLYNVDILYNFKYIDVLKKVEYTPKKNIKLCTFSRVLKEKGIENAINIVTIVNKKLGFNYCSLDIYGQIDNNYKDEFENLMKKFPNFIKYKGLISAEKSVSTIKNYDFLLFPTYYDGEGFAGTIIDAFSSGVPVIASTWKYNSEIIEDKKNGFLFETKNDLMASNIILDIYKNKYDILKMKEKCLEIAKKYIPEVAIQGITKYLNYPERLLCIVSSMNRGGAETFLMKVYRQLDKSKYQIDFCVSKKKSGFYDEEIKKLGGKIFYVPPKSKNIFKTFNSIKKLVKQENYKYVLRTSQQSLATLDLLAARFGGAKTLIYRSSNAGLTGGKMSNLINKTFSFLPKMIPNVKIAPSKLAAKFVFGNSKNVYILHNALNYDDFEFSEEIRNKIRKELKIGNKTLYGHVGRFNVQKNHMFLLEIFQEIVKIDKNSVLALIGEGELENDILIKIKELKLEKNVLVLGPKKNVNEYLMAFDKIIFPSFFEGMPNVIIEAQASGLPCFISNTITKEANITGLLTYIDLNKTSLEWADIIIKSKIKRKNTRKNFINNNYMIEQIVEEFVEKCYH